MNPSSRRVPIATTTNFELVVAGGTIGFFLIGFTLDPDYGFPAAIMLTAIPMVLFWRLAIGGIYREGSEIRVVNLTRTIRVEIEDIAEVGPRPPQMGRLFLVVRPDNHVVRMTASPQGGRRRERIRESLLQAINPS